MVGSTDERNKLLRGNVLVSGELAGKVALDGVRKGRRRVI
jgi:hypothetical protein